MSDTITSAKAATGPVPTRAGDLDPGVLVYVARERGLGPEVIAVALKHGCPTSCVNNPAFGGGKRGAPREALAGP